MEPQNIKVIQFVKVGDLFINTLDVRNVYRQNFTGNTKYTLILRDCTYHVVPLSDSITFERWLSTKAPV